MPFYKRSHGSADFVIHWDHRDHFPLRAFGVFAKGYAGAAKHLATDLLSRSGFADYEAYPVLLLYRHALELKLKGIIVKGTQLAQLTQRAATREKLQYIHRLSTLCRAASIVLRANFPADRGLEGALSRLAVVVGDFDELRTVAVRFTARCSGNASPAPQVVMR